MGPMESREGYHWSRGAWQPSAAQRRVLDGVAAGQTNAAIATQLGISSETVKWHISHLLAETGCADRHALARWWRAQRRRPTPALTPLLAAVAGPALAGLALVTIGLALAVVLAAARGRGMWSSAPAASHHPAMPTAEPRSEQQPPALVSTGLHDVGPFIRTRTGAVPAENRAAASVVHLETDDLVQFPPGMRWEPRPGYAPNPEYFLAPAVTVARQKLYVTVHAGGPTARFARVDDRTYRATTAGDVLICAGDSTSDTGWSDHRVAMDVAVHLLLDPMPVPGDLVAAYGSGEALDVRAMTVVGRLPPARSMPVGEWFFNVCERGRCSLSYYVGPLVAPAAGTLRCLGFPELDLDAGAFRLQFRDPGTTLRPVRGAPGMVPADCEDGRLVQVGEIITTATAHYLVSAVSAAGEPLSVVVAYDGTLYVGQLTVSVKCPPCRGN